MSRQFYLGKSGKTFGPYDEDRFEAMRAAGELEKYSWFWDSAAPSWQPIDPPPAPIDGQTVEQAYEEKPRQRKERPARAPAAPRTLPTYDADSIQAICHDHHCVVSGSLAHVTDVGCELVSRNELSGSGFAQRSIVMLNLLDEKTGKSMNVPARLSRVSRQDGAWNLSLRWDSCPEIIR